MIKGIFLCVLCWNFYIPAECIIAVSIYILRTSHCIFCLKRHASTDIFEEFHCFICKLCGRKLLEIEIFRDSFILNPNTYTSMSERSQNSIDNQSEELDLSAFDNPEAGEW